MEELLRLILMELLVKNKKDEIKKEYGFEQKKEVLPITKEEIKLGYDALEEILNDFEKRMMKIMKVKQILAQKMKKVKKVIYLN